MMPSFIVYAILLGGLAISILVTAYALSRPCESCGGPWAMQKKDHYTIQDEHLPEDRGFDVYVCRWCGVRDDWRVY